MFLYVWAGPNTVLAIAVGLVGLLTGGAARRCGGVLEFYGGAVALLLRLTPVGATALALGHAILGRHAAGLERTRSHELIHVRQAEIWGPLFIPAYCAASLWALITGKHFYRDNAFEIEARLLSEFSAP